MKSRKDILSPDTIGEPIAEEIHDAERLLLISAMPETASAESEGNLSQELPTCIWSRHMQEKMVLCTAHWQRHWQGLDRRSGL